MKSSKKPRAAIGFPPPLLGEHALRLPVVAEAAEWIALDKPAGVGLRAHPWDSTPDLDRVLNSQLDAGKPELLATGADLFASVYHLEPEPSGLALFAKGRDSLDLLRNACGSSLFQFRFLLVAGRLKEPVPESLSCDAPLLPHRSKNKMIPSTAKGKKAQTDFRRLAESPRGWSLWAASCRYFRLHQVRAHAAVLGIPVLGDGCYGGPAAPALQELMPEKRGPGLAAPAFPGLALHLEEVRLPASGPMEAAVLRSGPPKDFRVLLQRLDLADGLEK